VSPGCRFCPLVPAHRQNLHPQRRRRRHFSFESIGENANGLAGALFAGTGGGSSPSVTLDFYDRTGLGTFTR
jgi:hypothetical protein